MKYCDQPESLAKIGLANDRIKKVRRDAMTLGRLAHKYSASDASSALYNVIEDARLKASADTVKAIFDAGRDFCITYAEEVLDHLR